MNYSVFRVVLHFFLTKLQRCRAVKGICLVCRLHSLRRCITKGRYVCEFLILLFIPNISIRWFSDALSWFKFKFRLTCKFTIKLAFKVECNFIPMWIQTWIQIRIQLQFQIRHCLQHYILYLTACAATHGTF